MSLKMSKWFSVGTEDARGKTLSPPDTRRDRWAHLKIISSLIGTAALVACGSTPSKPTPNPTNGILGVLEVRIEGGDATATATARFVNPASLTGGIRSQTITAMPDTGLVFSRRAVAFFDSDDVTTRFTQAIFDITNGTGTSFNNLSFFAINVPVAVGGTAVGSVFSADGVAITDETVVRGLKPTHGVRGITTGLEVNPNSADLQLFTSNEALSVQNQAAALGITGTVLDYGFVARNRSGNRAIGAPGCAPAPDCNRAVLSLSYTFPRTTPRKDNPWAFSLFFVVTNQTESIASQGLNEQTTGTVAGLPFGNFAAFSEVRTLLGSSLSGPNVRFLCRARTAIPTATTPASAFIGAGAPSGVPDVCLGAGGPTNFTANVTAPTNVNLSWNALNGAIGYLLERRTTNGTYAQIAAPTTTAFADSSAQPETTYAYRVSAISNDGGQSNPTEIIDVTTPPVGIAGNAQSQTKGFFGPTIAWPLVAAFTNLLPDGTVLTWYSRDGDAIFNDSYNDQSAHNFTLGDIWNPVTGLHTTVTNTTTDLFCAGMALGADGKLYISGGNLGHDPVDGYYPGSRHTNIYDPTTSTFTRGPDMTEGRWYPSVITLSNGELLTIGGHSNRNPGDTTMPDNKIADVWNPITNTLRRLTNANADDMIPWSSFYPWVHVTPTGSVFYAGGAPKVGFLNTSGTGSWGNSYFRDGVGRYYGSSVMYAPGKILVLGGGQPAVTSTVKITTNTDETATITAGPSMAHARTHVSATILPDGRVFVNGGNQNGLNFDNTDAVLESEVYTPSTNTWTLGASAVNPRTYHSSAILLPDATVLTAGGGGCGTGCAANQVNAEVYYPSYLFKPDGSGALASRPKISGAPSLVGYNQGITVSLEQSASSIAKVSFVKLSAMTHAFNMGQVFVPATFAVSGVNQLSVTTPANSNVASPGYYMLFVVGTNGVPSKARMIKIN
jgi:Domain of unknown function (DUF1929)